MSQPLPNPNYFANLPLIRPANYHMNQKWIDEMQAHPGAQMCAFWQGAPLLHRPQPSGKSEVCWLTPAAAQSLPDRPEPIFLGLKKASPGKGAPIEEAPYFAVDFSDCAETLEAAPFADIALYRPLREVAFDLAADSLAILGLGLWLVSWRAKTYFSPRSGQPLIAAPGGMRLLDGEEEIFPRIDPVAITLVIYEDTCLLGRAPHFPPGWFSALAGYLEPGETLEECAAREIFEEAGLDIHSVAYQFSQPWPLSGALMAGFLAKTDDPQLTLDTSEVVEARWVPRREIQALLAGERRDDLCAPPAFTIAHQLLAKWVEDV